MDGWKTFSFPFGGKMPIFRCENVRFREVLSQVRWVYWSCHPRIWPVNFVCLGIFCWNNVKSVGAPVDDGEMFGYVNKYPVRNSNWYVAFVLRIYVWKCISSYISIHLENMPCKIHPTFLCNMLSTKVDGYSSQRLAHVAAFGPVNLTLEDRSDEIKMERTFELDLWKMLWVPFFLSVW